MKIYYIFLEDDEYGTMSPIDTKCYSSEQQARDAILVEVDECSQYRADVWHLELVPLNGGRS